MRLELEPLTRVLVEAIRLHIRWARSRLLSSSDRDEGKVSKSTKKEEEEEEEMIIR